MKLVKKKELQLILEERWPAKRFGVHKNNDGSIDVYYDAYMEEDQVEELKTVLDNLGVVARIERMVF